MGGEGCGAALVVGAVEDGDGVGVASRGGVGVGEAGGVGDGDYLGVAVDDVEAGHLEGVGGAWSVPVERDGGVGGIGLEVTDGIGGYGVDPGVGGDEGNPGLLFVDERVGYATVVPG